VSPRAAARPAPPAERRLPLPFCGFAFAPSYATIAPGLAARILDSQGALVRALAELQSMIDGRLQLDRAAVVAPVADALPAEPQPA